MRAIDEIEEHPELDNPSQAKLLRTISVSLQAIDGVVNAEKLSCTLSNKLFLYKTSPHFIIV